MTNRTPRTNLERRARIAILAAAAALTLALAGCTKTVNMELVDKPVPVYGSGEAQVSGVTSAPGQRNQTLTVTDNAPSISDRYAKWFTENGWRQVSQNSDVNQSNRILGRDRQQAIITYQAGRGTTVRVTAPAN